MRRKNLLCLLIYVLASVTIILHASFAHGHGYILRTLPANQAVLERAPTRIHVWASEALEGRFSTIALTTDRGKPIPLAEVGISRANGAQLTARLPTRLAEGAYLIRIRAAFASDGHVLNETRIFWVGERTDASAATGVSTTGAIPLEIIWRALQLPAASLLFGAVTLYLAVLLPGWGNATYAGGLAPRLMARLYALAWIGLLASLVATVLAVLQHSMTLFAADLDMVLRDGLWQIVLNNTQVGVALRTRLLLILLSAAINAGASYLTSRTPQTVRMIWTMLFPVTLLILYTMSITSHAAGVTLWAVPAIVVDWLHFAANAAWIGGLVVLSVILPAALGPLPTDERPLALQAVMGRFSALGVICVSLMISTGLFSSAIQIPPTADLSGTYYGQTLLSKVLLILPLLMLGAYHHVLHNPDRFPRLTRRRQILRRVGALTASLPLEAAFGLVVLLAAAVLSSTPPPVPPVAASEIPALRAEAISGTLRVQLTISPGAAGDNSYEVSVLRGSQPVEGASVQVRYVLSALDRRSRLLLLDDSGGGVYSGAGGEILRAGSWAALVDVFETDGTPSRVGFAWDIPATIVDFALRQPTLLNWLTAAAVVSVIAVWLWTPASHVIRLINPRPAYIVIGIAGLLATAFLTAIGARMLAESAAYADRLVNPTPTVLNTALLDAATVLRGRALFEQHCAACHTAENLPRTIPQRRLDDLRDERLFGIVVHGTGNLPPISLTDAQRWDVINYLRSAEFERKARIR